MTNGSPVLYENPSIVCRRVPAMIHLKCEVI